MDFKIVYQVHLKNFMTKTNFGTLISTRDNLNLLSANPTKWSNTNCLSASDHFMGLSLKELTKNLSSFRNYHIKSSSLK